MQLTVHFIIFKIDLGIFIRASQENTI